MKIPINLASEPFRRNRAMMVASFGVTALLLVTLGTLVYLAMVDNGQLKVLRRNIAQVNTRVAAANAERARLEAILHKPENASVLVRTVFINDLLYHKGVSWSQLLEDLEKTIPFNVKLLMLHPTVNNLNQVQLDMMVGAESPDALVGVLKSLETSPMFGEVLDHAQQYPTQAEPLNRMRITVNYAHKL
jgi:type IV pilus assembly protein PilN